MQFLKVEVFQMNDKLTLNDFIFISSIIVNGELLVEVELNLKHAPAYVSRGTKEMKITMGSSLG